MNTDIFIRRMKELNESINEAKRRINGRDRWRSNYGYEDDLEHSMTESQDTQI